MKLSEFLKKYRTGVNVATGKPFSVRMLADLLFVGQHNLAKWEQKGVYPISESDRLRVKAFFGVDDFENIENEVLKSAIKRYPNGLAKIEDLQNPKAQQIPLGGKTPPYKYGDESPNSDLPLQPTNNQPLIGSEVGEITSGNEEKNVNSMFTSNVPTMTENQLSLQLALQLAKNEADHLAVIKMLIEQNSNATLRLNRKTEKAPVKS